MTTNDSIALLLEQALKKHGQGEFKQAAACCEKILSQEPSHYDAVNLLGLIEHRLGNNTRAEQLLIQAIALNPSQSATYCNLGVIYKDIGKYQLALENFDKGIALNSPYPQVFFNRGLILQIQNLQDAAIESFKKAIYLKPDYAHAHFNLANSFFYKCEYKLAVDHYDQAIHNQINYIEALNNRGVAFKHLDQLDKAQESIAQALAINPNYADAYNNLGSILYEQGKFEQAIDNYKVAIALHPNFPQAFFNYGMAQEAIGLPTEAYKSYQQAIALQPNYPEVYSNLGVLMQKENHLEKSLAYLNRAIEFNPNQCEALNNRAVTLQNLKKFDQAITDLDHAILLNPNFAQAHTNRGFIYLLQGRFSEGWQEYEWRWDNPAYPISLEKPKFIQPLWLGNESIAGKTILLYGEQGLGDTIQFYRYVDMVRSLGATIILEVQAALISLLTKTCGVDQIVAKGDALPPFDFYCPLLSLPLAFNTQLESIPTNKSYLKIDPLKRDIWNRDLGEKQGLRVGLVWSGSTTHQNDHNRSIPLAHLLKALPENVQYVSLQKEIRDEDRCTLKNSSLEIYSNEQNLKDFSDTAALIDCLDLVISVDTSVAHVSGALGKKTWILLPMVPDWRWLLDRTDSPWYPSMTLYRQQQFNRWDEPLASIANDLTKICRED